MHEENWGNNHFCYISIFLVISSINSRVPKLTFRTLSLRQSEWPRAKFETLYGGQFTLSTRLIIPNYLIHYNSNKWTLFPFHSRNDAAPYFLRNLPLYSGLDWFGIKLFWWIWLKYFEIKTNRFGWIVEGRKGLARISYGELEWIWVGLDCIRVQWSLLRWISPAFPCTKSYK